MGRTKSSSGGTDSRTTLATFLDEPLRVCIRSWTDEQEARERARRQKTRSDRRRTAGSREEEEEGW